MNDNNTEVKTKIGIIRFDRNAAILGTVVCTITGSLSGIILLNKSNITQEYNSILTKYTIIGIMGTILGSYLWYTSNKDLKKIKKSKIFI